MSLSGFDDASLVLNALERASSHLDWAGLYKQADIDCYLLCKKGRGEIKQVSD